MTKRETQLRQALARALVNCEAGEIEVLKTLTQGQVLVVIHVKSAHCHDWTNSLALQNFARALHNLNMTDTDRIGIGADYDGSPVLTFTAKAMQVRELVS